MSKPHKAHHKKVGTPEPKVKKYRRRTRNIHYEETTHHGNRAGVPDNYRPDHTDRSRTGFPGDRGHNHAP
jgi:hypothetical protein